MDGVSNRTGGFVIPPGTPVLRGSDLLKEAEGIEAKTVDLGNGVLIEQRGGFRRMAGDAQMTGRAAAAAWEAAKIGGEAGRAMLETYRKTHPEEFGAAAVEREKLMKAGKLTLSPPSPQPPSTMVTVANGQEFTADPDQAVTVYGGHNVRVTGSAQSDYLRVKAGSTVFGLAGDDQISGGDGATLDGGDGDDTLSAGAWSHLYGGAGHDILRAGSGSTLYGGDGNDILTARDKSSLYGGTGNDLITALDDAVVDGGAGDDRVDVQSGADVTDLFGDNDIHVAGNSRLVSGDGNDLIAADNGSGTVIASGGGHDQVGAGTWAQVDTGAGDDMVVVGYGSTVSTGTGNDVLTVNGKASIAFNRGDGHDIIGGGPWGAAYDETANLSSSTLSFGAGISAADLTLQRQGNDLLVQVGNDSITLKDVQRHGIPTMTFADGSVLDGAHLEAMAGPAEPYRPLSQVAQNFADANRAYRNQLQTTGTAV